jgi:hypothetical protein
VAKTVQELIMAAAAPKSFFSKYPYPDDVRPSERYRKQRCSPKVVTREVVKAFQKAKKELEVEKTRQQRQRKLAALKKGEHEFDEFFAEQQGLSDWMIPDTIKQGVNALDRLSDAATVVATETQRTTNGIASFFSTNKDKLVAQVTLALGTIALKPTIPIVVLEILKIFVNYTSVLDNIWDYFSKIWPSIQNMMTWATGTAPQGSIEGGATAAEVQGDLFDFVPDNRFWATSGALAVGVGSLIGASFLCESTFEISKIATRAYKQASTNLLAKKIENNAEAFCGTVIEWIKKTMVHLFEPGTFTQSFENWLRTEKIDVKSFIFQVGLLTDPTKRDAMIANPQTAILLEELCMTANRIESAIVNKELNPESKVMQLLRDNIRKLANFAVSYENCHQEEVRDTPFCVTLTSAPGIGKSVLTRALAVNLCAPEWGCTVPVKQGGEFIYYRSSCDKYHTNYRQQSVYVVDDWGQSRSTSPDNSEMRDFIAIVSANPWSPPQASIADKGRAFDSKLVILTTNNPYPMPTEIVQPDAIYRRRNFVWELSLAKGASSDLTDVTRYRFQQLDKYQKIPIGPKLTFADALKVMVPVFNAWHDKNQEIKRVGFVPPPEDQVLGGVPTLNFSPLTRAVMRSGLTITNNLESAELQGGTVPDRYFDWCTRDQEHLDRRVNDPFSGHPVTWDDEDGDFQDYLGDYHQCLCCGSADCGEHPDQSVQCRLLDDHSTNFLWTIREADKLKEGLAEEGFGEDFFYCWDRKVVFYRQETGDNYQEFLHPTFSEPECVELAFYFLWSEGYFCYVNDDSLEAYRKWKNGDKNYLLPQKITYYAPYTCIHENEWLCDGSERVEITREEYYANKIEERERDTHRDMGLLFLNAVDPEYCIACGGACDLEDGYTYPRSAERQMDDGYESDEQLAAEVQNDLDQAEAEDEASILQRILKSAKHPHAITILKVVCGVGAVWLGVRSVMAIKNFFKTEKKINVQSIKTEQGIQLIVEELPPTLKDVGKRILQVVATAIVANTAAGAVSMCLEGGASAYGEAKTIRAIKRQNMKFARPILQAVRKQILSEGVTPFVEGDEATEVAELQGCSDPNGLDLITNVIGPKSVFTIERKRTEQEVATASGINRIKGFGIKGKLIAVPWHFIPAVPTVLTSTIHLANRQVVVSIDYTKAKRCEDSNGKMDLALIELDSGIESFKSIDHHFVRESQVKSLDRFKSMMVKHQSEAGGYFLTSNYIDTTSLCENESYTIGRTIDEANRGVGELLQKGYRYKIPSTKGDCGSLIIALDSSLEGKICGIHIAGIPNREIGLAIPITYEVLQANINKHFPKLISGTMREPDAAMLLGCSLEEQADKAVFLPDKNVEFVGTANPTYAQRLPNAHDIVPSRLFDVVYKHKNEPSVLTPKDPRIDRTKLSDDYLSPLQLGGEKYFEPALPFPADKVRLATTLMLRKLKTTKPTGMQLRLLTDEEVINGVPSAKYTGMDMSTSPGMPYKMGRPQGLKGKHAYFQFNEETQLYEPDFTRDLHGINPANVLYHNMKKWECDARNNQDVDFKFNYENLKQETLPISKIEIGKTRLFSCAPLCINMLFRKYFGAFVALSNQNCHELPSSVGINPQGYGWTVLAQRLLTKGDCHVAGDYKAWDGKLLGSVMGAAVKDVINPLYRQAGGTEEDDRVRMRLIEYAIHTYTMLANTLVQKHQGNPSGIPITSDLNSVCNWLYILVAFFTLLDEHRKKGPCEQCKEVKSTKVHDYIEMAFYGDDHVVSVGDECRCFFNFNTIQQFFKRHGVGYTDALKRGGVSPDFEPLAKVSYLKRGFVKIGEGAGERFLAPLELDSIKDQINWVKKSNNPTEALLQNVESAMTEFQMHGKVAYEEAARLITKGLQSLQDADLEDNSESFEVPEFCFEEERQKWLDECY